MTSLPCGEGAGLERVPASVRYAADTTLAICPCMSSEHLRNVHEPGLPSVLRSFIVLVRVHQVSVRHCNPVMCCTCQ